MKTKLFFLFSFLALLIANPAWGASLFLSPANGSLQVGEIKIINVIADSLEQSINAAEATITFDPKEIEVLSLSKAGSIFNIWAKEPSFSNQNGKIVFGGGLISGFSGASGKILQITFKTKAADKFSFDFASAKALAADGLGTDVLEKTTGASFSLSIQTEQPKPVPISEPTIEPRESAEQLVDLPKPQIKSTSHPDQNQWLENKVISFSWEVPVGVEKIQLLLDQEPDSRPKITYFPAISQKTIALSDDGIWFLHARFGNSQGWGPTSHYKVMIDATAPKNCQIVLQERDETHPHFTLNFQAEDLVSGIEKYQIFIGQEGAIIQSTTTQNSFYIPTGLGEGSYLAEMRAFDKTGNFSLCQKNFAITELNPPEIEFVTKKITPSSVLVIEGSSLYPNSQVMLQIENEQGSIIEQNSWTDPEGNWVIARKEPLKVGKYQVKAKIKLSPQKATDFSEAISFSVSKPPLLNKTATSLILLILILCWLRAKKKKALVEPEIQENN